MKAKQRTKDVKPRPTIAGRALRRAARVACWSARRRTSHAPAGGPEFMAVQQELGIR